MSSTQDFSMGGLDLTSNKSLISFQVCHDKAALTLLRPDSLADSTAAEPSLRLTVFPIHYYVKKTLAQKLMALTTLRTHSFMASEQGHTQKFCTPISSRKPFLWSSCVRFVTFNLVIQCHHIFHKHPKFGCTE